VSPAKQQEAFDWLSRGLDTALLGFIDDVKAGDTLLGCFYEFTYAPVADRLKAAMDRGVTVKLIIDAKVNEYTDKDGTFHPSSPRNENKATVKTAKLGKAVKRWREGNPGDIQHNKFMVWLKGAAETPAEVWTGSTNITESGIFGQTNVGHRVRDGELAGKFRDYWNAMLPDPGSTKTDSKADAKKHKKAWRDTVMGLGTVPATWQDIAPGVTPVFSPRSGSDVLEMYVAALDQAQGLACITLAFGIGQDFKTALLDNVGTNAITFLLLERQDRPKANATTPFVPLRAANNVYQAWGAFLKDPVYQWTRETNANELGITHFVNYIHSKFLLHDPLGADPIVITGSANFSDASTNDNDENMLLIRGDQRVADIYFTEFNRLFFHYYFRSVFEQIHAREKPTGDHADSSTSLFLDKTDGWLAKYKPGMLKTKRVAIFTGMAGAKAG
jgi:phosphatidylserine/phosphatidylglycerophosphate/cardiolipin synthase-like enzyme